MAKTTIRVRQIKSGSGYRVEQKATLRGLGLKRMNQVVELEDSPAVRGMIHKVSHLVRIESEE
jgi:large subunit ribosomal protein L30